MIRDLLAALLKGDADAPLDDYCWACNQLSHALIGFWAVLALSFLLPAWWAAGAVAFVWFVWETWQRLGGDDREGFRNVDFATDLAFEWSGATIGLMCAIGAVGPFMVMSACVPAGIIIGVRLRSR